MNQNDGVAAVPPLCGPTGGAAKSSPAKPAAANAFTPGPWEARLASDPEYGHGWWLHSPNYGAVGYWRGGRVGDTNRYWQLSETDARLISASPEGFELIEELEESFTADGTYQHFLPAMRAYLAKVRGEAL